MKLFKKQLFDIEVKGQGHTKVILVCNTLPYGHAPTFQISLTYLERQKCYGPDKKILFKKQLFDLEVKGQGPTKVITVCDTAIWSCTHIPNIIDLSGKTTKVMVRTSFAEKKPKRKKKKSD
jgi:hypothetical protein